MICDGRCGRQIVWAPRQSSWVHVDNGRHVCLASAVPRVSPPMHWPQIGDPGIRCSCGWEIGGVTFEAAKDHWWAHVVSEGGETNV